jgi:hypothetical protein
MNVLRFPDAPVKRVKKLVLIARSLFLATGLAACLLRQVSLLQQILSNLIG